MFYIVQNEELKIYDDCLDTLLTTLEFMPQLKEERVLETDIINADELTLHPNKVMIGDIEIEIDVPDFETQTKTVEEQIPYTEEIEKEIEYKEPIYETQTIKEDIAVGRDEDDNPIYETIEREEQVQIGSETKTEIVKELVEKFRIETKEVEEEVQVGSHKETIIVKGLVLNPDYEEEEKEKERERLNHLSLTKREVFLALYKDKGITPELLKASIKDAEALIEFEYANDYFRGNPLINKIGEQLGYTEEQLDYLFEHGEFEDTNIENSNI